MKPAKTDYFSLVDPATLRWSEEGHLDLLDQTRLPGRIVYLKLRSVETVARAIETMKVRGAPAIGVTAAFGVALGALKARKGSPAAFLADVEKAVGRLSKTRPTAVNLFWALDRMKRAAAKAARGPLDEAPRALLQEAVTIHLEDIRMNLRIGAHGASLLEKDSSVLTHCNAGSLATGGYGTALGVIRTAFERKKIRRVLVDETRPRLQGARLTAFELDRAGIPHVLICDNMAGWMMKNGEVDAVVVGADRIAANGDAANKIGTYSAAVLARRHKIPFIVAAPVSTIDFSLVSGEKIPIENRNSLEVTDINGKRTCPSGTAAANPAFDVTPNGLITAIVTEKGVFKRPYRESFKTFYSAKMKR